MIVFKIHDYRISKFPEWGYICYYSGVGTPGQCSVTNLSKKSSQAYLVSFRNLFSSCVSSGCCLQGCLPLGYRMSSSVR